jgi:hypothetical protein
VSDDKVIYLAFRNEDLPPPEEGRLACGHCRNKTWLVIYGVGDYPRLQCASCGEHGGRIGWAAKEAQG